ncbi:DUF2786 domain-containing protein [Paraburkholderia humisilvae]|uniref:Uncharacterized protein n=1 Tax=Paraburkholderia humisilvae TaxID=627669 RepID=A0A6J5ECJ5_9BURK|nr:DUF2786 domain-containing protein [Paraburkholderia humisilvae]CAB3764189.1 hypothetical protein LMG29542_04807 [Paraburkholderia humisilvae]
MDKKTALNKIRKCLALAKSSEPHEAAAAMRQAQKLMREYGFEHPDLIAAGADEQWAKSASTKTPVWYEVGLASTCARAYGCEMVFSRRLNERTFGINGGYVFIGIAPAPEVCAYTFEVLGRQLRRARRHYIETELRRCGPNNKVARADEFCGGWVAAVEGQIQPTEQSAEQARIVDAYMRAHYAAMATMSPRSREVSRSASSVRDRSNGIVAGSGARVRPGVGSDEPPMAIGHSGGAR